MREYRPRLACILGAVLVIGGGCATGGDDDDGLPDTPGADGGSDTSVSHPHDSGSPPPYDSGNPPPDDSGSPPPFDSGEPPPFDSGSPPPFDSGNPPPPFDSGTGGACDLSNSSQADIYAVEAGAEEVAGTAVACGSGCSSGDCCYTPLEVCVPQ